MTSTTEIGTTAIEAGVYSIDPSHTRVGFVARHAMITKVRGAFSDLAGSGSFDPADPTKSKLNVVIQAASLDTGSADRDGHVLGEDFLDVEKFPTIEFNSTAVTAVDASNYQVTGDLKIKDVTKAVTLDLEITGTAVDPWNNTRLGLEGSTTVSRKEWGLTWNAALDAGGVMVGDKVVLEFDVSAIRSTDA